MKPTIEITLLASRIAEYVFHNRTDKGGTPYIMHLDRVARNAYVFFEPLSTDTSQQAKRRLFIIGMLHDLMEDCPEWTLERLEESFPDKVILKALDLLTKKPESDYQTYIRQIAKNKYAKAVKLADLRDNMDISRLPKLTDADCQRLIKYHQAYKFLMDKTKL